MRHKTKLKQIISKIDTSIFPCVVIAFKYDQIDDFYVVGAVCDHITAERLAFDEADLRGGKYTCKVINLLEDFTDKWNKICDELGAKRATVEEMLNI